MSETRDITGGNMKALVGIANALGWALRHLGAKLKRLGAKLGG
jgi:hypothetical protein